MRLLANPAEQAHALDFSLDKSPAGSMPRRDTSPQHLPEQNRPTIPKHPVAWKMPGHQQHLIASDPPHRIFVPPAQRRAPLMTCDRIRNIDARVAFCCTSNSKLYVLEIGLESLIQQPYAPE